MIAKDDRAARDQLMLANPRLVVRSAGVYVSHGVAREDLIAEGNVGLLRTVEGEPE